MPHTLLAGVVAFFIAWTHGPAPSFVYDGAQYWGGAAALAAGEAPLIPGVLTMRGVFTTLVYLPPAVVTELIGPGAAIWTVLAWNAMLSAVVFSMLIPRIAGLVSPKLTSSPPPLRIWVSTVVGSAMLAGFARFPLVEVWAVSLALAGFYGLIVARRWYWLTLAGLSLTVAGNLRPSMIAPVLLAVAVLSIVRAKPIATAAPAAALAVAPQIIFNVLTWGLWSPVPPHTASLIAVQSAAAPHTLRYDTVPFAGQHPQQWYCDPQYAALLADDRQPRNQFEVIASAFQHLPDSLWFLLRKAAAGLHWSLATPYENPPDQSVNAMAILVITVSTFGVTALILQAIRTRSHRRSLVTTLAMLAFLIGALATLVLSTPETRFAVPIVLLGLVGVVSVAPELKQLRAPSRSELFAAGCALLIAIGLIMASTEALGHDMPPGPLADATACVKD
ncbi:MAG: hypothetical protein ACRCSP_08070 [Rhodoglobus sp.]